jgi:hypothetical protein
VVVSSLLRFGVRIIGLAGRQTMYIWVADFAKCWTSVSYLGWLVS